MNTSSPVVKHLVLVGGGHSHLAVLKQLGMHPVPGLAVTMISRDINTPYSGSLPGLIAGTYQHDQIHIDLRPLAQFAGVRLIQEEISHLDLERKRIELRERPPIDFDIISLNIGSRPDAHLLPGAAQHAVSIKPIDQFLVEWENIRSSALSRLGNGQTYAVAVVGGGPASVEFAFAAGYRIQQDLGGKGNQAPGFDITLLSADDEILSQHNARVRAWTRQELEARGVKLLLEHRVNAISAGEILCDNGTSIAADAIVLATGASIPEWPQASGLAISDDGFIEVQDTLQSTSHDFVFAAGDAATIKGQPRPKSGVYAVRQGKPLARNLVRFATGRSLKRYRPQKHALALLSMGDKTAIASRHRVFRKGPWVWRLKHRIDNGFLEKYRNFPDMSPKLELQSGLVDKQTEQALREHAMRCAGCGAKVSGGVLSEVLAGIPKPEDPRILNSDAGVEDASVIDLEDGRVLVQSVDQIRAFINDPWLFARIATNHCLSDIHAMGCKPHSALLTLGIPFASKRYTRALLNEVMQGCSDMLAAEDCSLIGGHSAESAELSIGLCVNGFGEKNSLLTKGGMAQGDVLILCKPLGTGTLLAADMRCKATHDSMACALEQMLRSNGTAATLLREQGASACTDITGFGLAGHLLEMLQPGRMHAELRLSDLPVLDGALDSLDAGIISSLHKDNSLNGEFIYNSEAFLDDPRYQLLFDPQTSGGLLATLPPAAAESCLRALRDAGYGEARVIGTIGAAGADQAGLVLR